MKRRQSIEQKFVFGPVKAIDPQDVAKIEQDISRYATRRTLRSPTSSRKPARR